MTGFLPGTTQVHTYKTGPMRAVVGDPNATEAPALTPEVATQLNGLGIAAQLAELLILTKRAERLCRAFNRARDAGDYARTHAIARAFFRLMRPSAG